MNRGTEQFETVLPDSLRRRYRAPRPKFPLSPPQPLRRKALSTIDRAFAGIVIGLGTLVAVAIVIANRPQPPQPQVHYLKAPEADPVRFPVTTVELGTQPTPIPEPTPEVQWTKPDPWKPAEVRRAPTPIHESGFAQMPYGETLWISILGNLPNQESLPRTGNHIGDAYRIGKDVFAWVAPNGIGQWIDPQ
jgi:hypothetical protein